MYLRGLVLGLVCGAALAADAPAPTTSAAPESIETAKRDFSALKNAKSALPEKTELPRMSTPELNLPATPLPTLGGDSQKSKSDPKAAAKNKNWLVDAMMKPKVDPKDPRGSSSVPGLDSSDDKLASVLTPGEAAVRAAATTETGDSADANGKTRPSGSSTTKLDNPLNQYMAGWMTPSDFATLQQVMNDGAKGVDAGAGFSPRGGAPTTANIDLSTLREGPVDLGASSRSGRGGAITPIDNPFLKGLDSVPLVLDSATSAPSGPTAPAWTPTALPAAVEPKPTPQTAIPDFAKPSEDAKYFKQLKRF